MSRDLYAQLQNQRGDNAQVIDLGHISTLESFSREVDAVEQNMQMARTRMDELDQVQRRAMNAVSEQETAKLERQLDRLTDDINQINNTVNQQLQGMQASFRALPPDAELQIRRNQHSALTRKFMALLTDYQNVQKRNRDQARERFARQYRIVNPDATDDEVRERLDDSSNQAMFSNQLLDQTRGHRARLALQQAEDRHRDVERIGRSINDVQQLFLDLQRMVDQQGETLDRIEDNVNQTGAQMEKADQSLVQAVDSARASRKKRWCLFITFMVILVVVIVGLLIYFLPQIKAVASPSPAPAPAPSSAANTTSVTQIVRPS